MLEALAGLLSAGTFLIGLGLATLKVAAPAIISGSGLSATDGPRWDRALVGLLVGALGELLHVRRARMVAGVRPVVAAVVVLAVLLALWWGWWR